MEVPSSHIYPAVDNVILTFGYQHQFIITIDLTHHAILVLTMFDINN